MGTKCGSSLRYARTSTACVICGKVMHAANERYLAFIAAIDNPNAGLKAIDKVAQPVREDGRSYRGFNLFLSDDYHLFLTLARGEWCISGFRAVDLRAHLPWLTPTRCSWLLKRLRTHGLIQKVGRRYKYYLTRMGRRVLVTALNIRESVVLPALCEARVCTTAYGAASLSRGIRCNIKLEMRGYIKQDPPQSRIRILGNPAAPAKRKTGSRPDPTVGSVVAQ